jgi:putative molybdopterin biosynthesis protein
VSPVDGSSRPAPRVAYERWLDALARAGWTRPGEPGQTRAPGADGVHGDAELPGERIHVAGALGRVTAAPVIARWPSPRDACAAMDGIAVRAADLAAARSAAVAGPAAGDQDPAPGDDDRAVRLAAGTFSWIDTGDPMPAGLDTVVVRERLRPQDDGGVIVTAVAGGPGSGRPGEQSGHTASKRNVRAVGEDFAAGELLVPAGRRLRPGDLAAAAAGGHLTVAVLREPVVAIIPTGDEIRPVGPAVAGRGEILDTNSLMLAARCHQLGAVPVVSTVVPDDPDALAAELRRAAARADLVLVIAGSSRGRDDHTGAVLAQVGGVAVAGVAVRPGHPALLGHAKRPDVTQRHPGGPDGAGPARGPAAEPGRARPRTGAAPVIGLPGYPLATAVVFELFAVPLLGALTGQAPVSERVRARLDRDWSSPADTEEWVLVTLAPGGEPGIPLAAPGKRGAGSISQLARADAWWPVPAGQGSFAAGTEIEVFPVPGTSWPGHR